jgi:hypothetical protein
MTDRHGTGYALEIFHQFFPTVEFCFWIVSGESGLRDDRSHWPRCGPNSIVWVFREEMSGKIR